MYHGLHGPDDCGVYCLDEAGVTPYWNGVEKCDDYEGKVVLPRTGSDEPVDSFVCTTGSDEPVASVVCTTGSDEPVASVVHTTGSNEPVVSVVCTPGPAEPVNDVTPAGPVIRNMTIMWGKLSCPGLGPMSRSTVLLVLLGPKNRSTVLL